jgi:hypothetical protein
MNVKIPHQLVMPHRLASNPDKYVGQHVWMCLMVEINRREGKEWANIADAKGITAN